MGKIAVRRGALFCDEVVQWFFFLHCVERFKVELCSSVYNMSTYIQLFARDDMALVRGRFNFFKGECAVMLFSFASWGSERIINRSFITLKLNCSNG